MSLVRLPERPKRDKWEMLLSAEGITVRTDTFGTGEFEAIYRAKELEHIDDYVMPTALGPTREQAVYRLKEQLGADTRASNPDLSVDEAFTIFRLQQKIGV